MSKFTKYYCSECGQAWWHVEVEGEEGISSCCYAVLTKKRPKKKSRTRKIKEGHYASFDDYAAGHKTQD